MLSIKTEINTSDLADVLLGLVDYAEHDSIPVAAHTSQGQHVRRWERGDDVDGGKLKPYSPSYKKTRAKKGLRTSPPNFRVTGETIDSFELRDNIFGPSSAKRPIVEGNAQHRGLVGVTESEAEVQAKDIVSDMKRKGLVH